MRGVRGVKPWTKNQIRRIRLFLMLNSDKRNCYLKKHHVFREMGENVFFQPRMIPADPHLILFHNNVVVTSNVTFVNHDIFHLGLNQLHEGTFSYYQDFIEVMDNVFIGCNSTILGGVRIGPNAIVAAGSVVTKDVLPNTVVAGNPAKKIGTFDDYVLKRKNLEQVESLEELFERFQKSHE